ncbi:MAG TPA: glycine zipper domain-containing protein [Pirellulales bacterium]|nr:glycine zipper domain-containing protein [Pirellulales bacterium]
MERSPIIGNVFRRGALVWNKAAHSRRFGHSPWPIIACLSLLSTGCASPYHADRGALFGGAAGAGVGALVGEAVGHPGVGALVGAGVGTISGAAVGGSLDEMEARNRAMIASQMGRQVPRGAVGVGDVIDMTRQGLDEDLIVNHIRYNGVQQPPQSRDLIAMQQNGVGKRVIEAMQAAPLPQQPGAVMAAGPPPFAGPPVYYPPPPVWGPYPYYYPPPPPAWGFGMSFR